MDMGKRSEESDFAWKSSYVLSFPEPAGERGNSLVSAVINLTKWMLEAFIKV